jgi:hypothetical protein
MARREVGSAARAALRSQARAIDTAEAMADPELVTKANAVYLEMRHAEGLRPLDASPTDPFADLMARLSRATSGSSDTPDP